MATRRSDTHAVNRGLLWGIAVGLAFGLALLVAPSALAAGPSVIGTVYAVAPDGAGGYYAGGSFSVPTTTIVNAVHINPDLTVDTAWAPNPKPKHGKLVRPKYPPGALPIVVRCDQSASASLAATVTEPIGKKPKHGKQPTKTVRLGPVRASLLANKDKTLTLQLTPGLLTDLKHHAKMSVALTLAATGSGGPGRATATVAALTGI